MDEGRLARARALHRDGKVELALAAYREMREAEPGSGELSYLCSLAEHELGLAREARANVDRALALSPDQPFFRLHSAHLAQDAGDLGLAERELRRAVELKPDWALAWTSLGTVLLDAQRAGEALPCFERAIALEPTRARSWNNLGLALEALGRPAEAGQAFGQALSRDPGYALAHYNLGRWCLAAGDADNALAHAMQACRLAPRHVEAQILAGDLLRRRQDVRGALAAYRHAIAADPSGARARNALAESLWETGDAEAARREFEAAARAHPRNLKAALGSALLLPPVYAGTDHLEQCRERYGEGLRRLAARAGDFSWGRAGDALAAVAWSNFYLAYQGRDDRELQSLYGDFIRDVLRRSAPRYLDAAPARVRAGIRLRVGFASNFFYDCTAGRYFASWIRDLDASRFETFAYHVNPRADELTRAVAASAAHFRPLAMRPVQAVADQILADGLDILVYPELGMHTDTFALASLRLAPVQCAGWGHPTTTGLPSMDWYLSCESMEPEGAQSSYRERLALLPGLGTDYALPSGEAPGRRQDFGLPEGRRLYLVPQSLFKIHPDNDELIAGVLAADPEGLAVLFDAHHPALVEAFAARLAPVLAARGLSTQRHLLFLPTLSHGRYLRVNRLCDVMLDTLHWSGGNTTLDAIAMGLPVVTLPGALMRGRQSQGMLRMLGLDELIARDREDYVRIAVDTARDPGRRSDLSRRMAQRSGELFGQRRPVAALEEFLGMAAAAPTL